MSRSVSFRLIGQREGAATASSRAHKQRKIGWSADLGGVEADVGFLEALAGLRGEQRIELAALADLHEEVEVGVGGDGAVPGRPGRGDRRPTGCAPLSAHASPCCAPASPPSPGSSWHTCSPSTLSGPRKPLLRLTSPTRHSTHDCELQAGLKAFKSFKVLHMLIKADRAHSRSAGFRLQIHAPRLTLSQT